MRTIIAAAAMAATPALADNSITITGAAGEFENRRHTERYTLELRLDALAPGNAYPILHAALHDHPRPEIENRVMVGAGYYWRGWNAELIGDDDRYLASLMYTAPTEVWELRGGVMHGNKWSEGFKQTGLKLSVGYPIGPMSVGAFYEIGNTTMRSVDDLYGGYLSWRW